MSAVTEAQDLVDRLVETYAKVTGARPAWVSGRTGRLAAVALVAMALEVVDARIERRAPRHWGFDVL